MPSRNTVRLEPRRATRRGGGPYRAPMGAVWSRDHARSLLAFGPTLLSVRRFGVLQDGIFRPGGAMAPRSPFRHGLGHHSLGHHGLGRRGLGSHLFHHDFG